VFVSNPILPDEILRYLELQTTGHDGIADPGLCLPGSQRGWRIHVLSAIVG